MNTSFKSSLQVICLGDKYNKKKRRNECQCQLFLMTSATIESDNDQPCIILNLQIHIDIICVEL